jgi:predicted nucleotidyltransferase
MPQAGTFDAVFSLEAALGVSWPHIRRAHQRTQELHMALSSAIEPLGREDASIVVFGSLGRFEVTSESDIDWTYLIDGQADLRHQATALQVDEAISAVGKKRPGREGVFGNLAFSHDLLQYIGGQDDTNANLTRRILLLLESRPIGRREAYDRVLRVVLDRYLSGDHGWMRSRTPYGVPRFLHNDIARYWRTVAVDFAYKQWTRDNQGWALRSAKLRMSRKLTYAAGLLYSFGLAEAAADSSGSESIRKQQAIERLWILSGQPPLDSVARTFAKATSLADAARGAFSAYDEFLAMLENAEIRDRLDKLPSEDADQDEHYQRVRVMGRQFQDGLSQLFITDESTQLPKLTREYGVF